MAYIAYYYSFIPSIFMEENMVKFIHSADCHLGVSFKTLTPSQSICDLLERGLQRAFLNVIQRAIEEKVDFLLISGDLFDSESPSLSVLLDVKYQFERLKDENILVYITRGNHDYKNHWCSIFPENVYFFSSNVETMYFTSRKGENIAISGFSYSSRWIGESQDEQFPIRDRSVDYHIGMYHGDRLSTKDSNRQYAPFSLSTLKEKQYDYWALGHIHKSAILSQSPFIAYSGNIQGLNRNEVGSKGAYLVQLERYPIVSFFTTSEVEWDTIVVEMDKKRSVVDFYHEIKQMILKKGKHLEEKKTILYTVQLNVSHSLSDGEQKELEYMLQHEPIAASIWVYHVRIEYKKSKHIHDGMYHQLQVALEEFQQSTPFQNEMEELFSSPIFLNQLSEWKDNRLLQQDILERASDFIQHSFLD